MTDRRVTADDVVPSIRRWSARDGAGQHMMQRVQGSRAEGRETFTIALKERYGLILDVAGEDRDAGLLHDAQEGSRDRSDAEDL